jgi:phosphatidylinositol alpha-1,6-mannosyltransferase
VREVLFVSKPVAPPWNDSNKNLVRDVARGLERYRARVLVPRGAPLEGVLSEPLYAEPGAYAPSRLANARVLTRLLAGPRVDLWHFFFGPNPLTLRAGALAARLRRAKTVHTIASAPDDLERIAPLLFADRVIALSAHTTRRLERAGVRAVTIPPALEPPTVSAAAIVETRARYGLPPQYLLYPGDLEFGNGAETFVRAAAQAPGLGWVVASRPKTPRALEARARLEAEARAIGAPVIWLGEVSDIHALVAGAGVVVLVSDTLHAKMDWPLVLLEALALEVPVLVAQDTAAAELVVSQGATAVPHGDPAALVTAAEQWLAFSKVEAQTRLAHARRWVEETCAPAVVARAHEALYDAVLGVEGR